MIKILKDLKAEAQKLIDDGNSLKKAKGKGMMDVINALNSQEAKEEIAIEKAGNYLCDDELTIAEQVKLIKEHENPEDFIDNVEGVMVWKKMEYTFTCKEFLELLNDYGV